MPNLSDDFFGGIPTNFLGCQNFCEIKKIENQNVYLRHVVDRFGLIPGSYFENLSDHFFENSKSFAKLETFAKLNFAKILRNKISQKK